MASLSGMLLLLLVGLLLIAGFWDIRYRRLPNWLAGATLVLGSAHLFASTGSLGEAGFGLLHAGAALIVGMVLFRAALVGGGDAKFYAAVAAGVPIADGLRLLVYIAVSGLLAVLLWFVIRRGLGKAVSAKSDGDFAKFPLGVAISLGSLVYYGLQI
ncbi:MAG: prepilin peptidase [Novosphingobium sp.]